MRCRRFSKRSTSLHRPRWLESATRALFRRRRCCSSIIPSSSNNRGPLRNSSSASATPLRRRTGSPSGVRQPRQSATLPRSTSTNQRTAWPTSFTLSLPRWSFATSISPASRLLDRRVDVMDIVVIVEGVEKIHHVLASLLVELWRILGHVSNFGGQNLPACRLQRLGNGIQILDRGEEAS